MVEVVPWAAERVPTWSCTLDCLQAPLASSGRRLHLGSWKARAPFSAAAVSSGALHQRAAAAGTPPLSCTPYTAHPESPEEAPAAPPAPPPGVCSPDPRCDPAVCQYPDYSEHSSAST